MYLRMRWYPSLTQKLIPPPNTRHITYSRIMFLTFSVYSVFLSIWICYIQLSRAAVPGIAANSRLASWSKMVSKNLEPTSTSRTKTGTSRKLYSIQSARNSFSLLSSDKQRRVHVRNSSCSYILEGQQRSRSGISLA
jgi:hypothetical protein